MQADPSWHSKDFYRTLGVDKTATDTELKSAYRKLSKELHPDTNSGDGERFKEVAEAYSVLRDPEKRKAYDSVRALYGSSPSGFGFAQGAGTPYSGFSMKDVSFEDLFGGFAGHPRQTKIPSRSTAKVTFEEAALGCSITMVSDEGPFTVAIPRGVEDGSILRVAGVGPGNTDLLLTIEIEPHRMFSRSKLDLLLDLPITFDEAALGATVEAPVFPSGSVRVKIPAGSPNGRTLRIAGKGLSNAKGDTGDLLLTLKVEVPKSLTPEAIAALQAYREATVLHTPRSNLLD